MSDWKSRAIKVDDSQTAPDWKSRASTAIEEPTTEEVDTGSDLKDLGIGAAQGATLGFADEIYGGLKGAKEALTSEKQFVDEYRKAQKEAETSYKEAKERSPWLVQGAEVAGGLLIPGGAGLQGAKALKGLGAIKKAALIGSIGGGIAGAGSSEGTLESPEELGKDIALGGAVGGVLGGATGLAKVGFDKLAKNLGPEESPGVRQVLKSFEEGKEGKGFYNTTSGKRVNKESEEVMRDLVNKMTKGMDYANEEYDKFLTPFKNPLKHNLTSEALEPLSDLEMFINSKSLPTGQAAAKRAIDDIQRFKSNNLTPQEIKNLQVQLREIGSGLQGEGAALFKKSSGLLEGELKKLPGYDKLNELYRTSREIPETILNKVPADLNDSLIGDLSKQKESLAKAAQKIITKSQDEALVGREQAQQMDRFATLLNKVKTENPKVLEAMGISDVDKYQKKIRDAADIENIYQNIQGQNTLDKNALIGTGKRVAYTSANLTGQALGGLKNSVAGKVSGGVSKNLYKLGETGLRKVSDGLKQSGNLAYLGTALEEALNNKSAAAKNAVLFSIAQNPDAREMIDIFGLKDEE